MFAGVLNVLVPLRLHELGASGVAVGAAFLVAALAEAFVSPLAGRLSDRRGRLTPLRFGLGGALLMAERSFNRRRLRRSRPKPARSPRNRRRSNPVQVASRVVQGLIELLLIVVISIYLLLDGPRISRGVDRVFPPGPDGIRLGAQVQKGLIRYVPSEAYDSSDDKTGLLHSFLGSVTWQATPRLSLTLAERESLLDLAERNELHGRGQRTL